MPIRTCRPKRSAELIAYAKANPGKLSYGSGNTTGSVGIAQIAAMSDIKMVHIPYKGEPAALADLLAGRIDLMIGTLTTGLTHVKAGTLRALATTLQATIHGASRGPHDLRGRLAAIHHHVVGRHVRPGQPAARKSWRASTPCSSTVMKEPEVAGTLEKQGFSLAPSTPDALGKFLAEQIEAWKVSARAVRIEPE